MEKENLVRIVLIVVSCQVPDTTWYGVSGTRYISAVCMVPVTWDLVQYGVIWPQCTNGFDVEFLFIYRRFFVVPATSIGTLVQGFSFNLVCPRWASLLDEIR